MSNSLVLAHEAATMTTMTIQNRLRALYERIGINDLIISNAKAGKNHVTFYYATLTEDEVDGLVESLECAGYRLTWSQELVKTSQGPHFVINW